LKDAGLAFWVRNAVLVSFKRNMGVNLLF